MDHEDGAKVGTVSNDNPYNIDFARERRLRMWFIGLIGGAFLLAAVLVLLAFLFDALAPEIQPSLAPLAPPVQGVQTGGSYDGPAALIT
jgi:hypothetical protein